MENYEREVVPFARKRLQAARTLAFVLMPLANITIALSQSPGSAPAATASQPLTPQNPQTSPTPQAPGGPQDQGNSVVIFEGPVGSLSGGQQLYTVLRRDPNDPEHAFDTKTERNFHWDPATNQWVNSATGQGYIFMGYLSASSGSATTPTTPGTVAASTTNANATPQNPQTSPTPQAPGGPQDQGDSVVIFEGTVGSLSGGQQLYTVLRRDPNEPEHAFDTKTERNFHWDPATNQWVNSATGQGYIFMGYLSASSGPSATPGRPSTSPASASAGQATPLSKPSPLPSQTSIGTTGSGIQFQLRGIGGASFINGNTPATAGFDGAVLFPLGNRVSIGPSAGFQWINSSLVNSIGSMSAGSTFIDTSAGFKEGNFGGQIVIPFGGFQVGAQGGASIDWSSIIQASGFCGLGNATSPAGCTVSSTTTTHDTVTGPFVGGFIQHSIFSHIGIFAGYDYRWLKITPPSSGSSTTPTTSSPTLDLNHSEVIGGFTFTFGSYQNK